MGYFENKLLTNFLFTVRKYLVVPSIPVVLVILAKSTGLYAQVIESLAFWMFLCSYYALYVQEKWYHWKWRKVERNALQMCKFDTIGTRNIKVLSYNIFLRPPLVKNNKDDFKNERMREFMKRMKDYDVVALQEIFALGNWRQKQLIDYAQSIGFHFHVRSVRPPFMSKKFIDAGLLILSKYPIVERDGIVYDFGNQIDSWAAKQVIYAKIQVAKEGYFHLFTTHMQASYFDSPAWISKHSDQARLGQVDQYAAFVNAKIQNNTFPALITGDFNINSRHPEDITKETEEYMYLVEKLNSSCTPNHHPIVDLLKQSYNGHPTTFGDVHPEDPKKPREVALTHPADVGSQLSIDYMFFLDSMHNQQCKKITCSKTKVEEFFMTDAVPFSQLSDHYGVTTVLTVNDVQASEIQSTKED